MKFGRTLKSHASQDGWAGWAPYYLDYKGLKKIINSLAKGRPADAALLATGERPPPEEPNGHDLIPRSHESALLQHHKAAFFFKLERELEKKENEFKVRLRSLIDKRKVVQASTTKLTKDSSSFIALSEGFRHYERDLSKLQNFIEINAEGFRKILKKWDKRSKSSTKELYLARQIEVQPCFNREIIAELSDAAAANILKLDALLDHTGALLDGTTADGIASDRKPETAQPSHNDADVLEEIEASLTQALAQSDTSAVTELLERIPRSVEGVADHTRMRVSRILWRAAIDPRAASLIPVERLDFSFVDDINGRSALHEAAGEGRLDLVKLCVERGVPITQADVYGRTALHYACLNGREEVTAYLLGLNALDVYATDLDGYSAPVYAVTRGRTHCVKALIEHGVSFEPRPSSEVVPLSLACQHGHVDIALLLLERGCKVIPDAVGFLPQHLAAREGHARVLRLLAEHGADMDAIDKYSNWTPLFHAASEGHASCVSSLLEARAAVRATDELHKTPLHYAAWQGHIECVNLLIAAGASEPPPRPVAAVGNSGSSAAISRSSDELEPLDLDGDVDPIPSLSLPPPIIRALQRVTLLTIPAFRIYGHSYLDRKALVQVSLGHPNSHNAPPPLRLHSQSQLSSLKLVMLSGTAIPHSVILPLSDDREVFSFQVDSFPRQFTLEFELYPTFGSRVIGKAVALPSTFSDLRSQGSYTIPLLDHHLKIIGEVAFEVSCVQPFEAAKLSLGGRVETYWKATVDGPAVAASSLQGGEHVRVCVQSTRDGVPVVWGQWRLPIEGFDLFVSDVTVDQFTQLAERSQRRFQAVQGEDPRAWAGAIANSLGTLEEVLAALPSSVGVLFEVRYPTLSDQRRLGVNPSVDVNVAVDAVLRIVYGQTGRRIVFSSFNPVVCTALNWKQPNYAVCFASFCGLSRSNPAALVPANRVEDDRRCTSIREAVKFAKANNLLGVMFDSTLLSKIPSLIESVKEYGLLMTTFGTANVPASDAHLADGVWRAATREFLTKTE